MRSILLTLFLAGCTTVSIDHATDKSRSEITIGQVLTYEDFKSQRREEQRARHAPWENDPHTQDEYDEWKEE